MSRRVWITLVSGLFITISVYSQDNFISPLKIALSLSANFGELRADHYHSGIDIRTQGVTGKEVVAADKGFVYLILVSPVGFGKAIFVRHPSGYSTVYGHLDSYAPDIEEYVKAQQYRNKSYAITIYPPEGRLPVTRGQLLGYSGNTGSSSGPHLHFEVRKTDGEKPVNPEKFSFAIEDNIKPVIERLVVYPIGKNTFINGRSGKLFLNVTGGNGHYQLTDELIIQGTAGFGITSYDYMNDTPNRFGISSIDLTIDSIPWFSYEVNEFSFYETRYINAHIDYEESVKKNLDIERTFVLPDDKLSLYRSFMNNGLFDFTDNKIHNVSIKVKDGKGNSTTLSFSVVPGMSGQYELPEMKDSTLITMPYEKENQFVAEGIKLVIPKDALYDTLFFKYSAGAGNDKLFSRVHHIHDRFTPVQKPVTLSIKPDSIPTGKESKLLLVQIDEKGVINGAGGKFIDGAVSGDLLSLGTYAIGIDTVAPVIYANGLSANSDLTGKNEIRIRIKDDLSGIKSYSGIIDGNWALFEYDSKNDLVFYRFDPKRITKGIRHTLILTVTDNCDNESIYTKEFIW